MQKYFVILFLLIPFIFADAAQKNIFIVQSSRIRPYSEAVEGFKSTCQCATSELVLSEAEGLNIFREIRSSKPDLIFAVGSDALLGVKAIKDIPIVYAMVSNPDSLSIKGPNITGVSINIMPERQLAILREAFPDLHRIGIIYNPLKSGHFIKKVLRASKDMPIKIIAKEIHDPKDIPIKIDSLKGKIDLFWMIPDSTIFSPAPTEYLFLFSYENKIPVLTFSEKYLSMGAVLSANIDANDIGRQAGEMTAKILSGTEVEDLPSIDARKAIVTVNPIAAKKLGRNLDKDFFTREKHH